MSTARDDMPPPQIYFDGEATCPWCRSDAILDATVTVDAVLSWLEAGFVVTPKATPPVNEDGTAEVRHPHTSCPNCCKPVVISAKAFTAEDGMPTFCEGKLHPCRTSTDVELAQRDGGHND